jgi:hypothetical protein
MAEKKICGVCMRNEASLSCSGCGIPLCEMCKKEVISEESGPAYKIKGKSTTVMGSAELKKIMCPKCMKEVDIF